MMMMMMMIINMIRVETGKAWLDAKMMPSINWFSMVSMIVCTHLSVVLSVLTLRIQHGWALHCALVMTWCYVKVALGGLAICSLNCLELHKCSQRWGLESLDSSRPRVPILMDSDSSPTPLDTDLTRDIRTRT